MRHTSLIVTHGYKWRRTETHGAARSQTETHGDARSKMEQKGEIRTARPVSWAVNPVRGMAATTISHPHLPTPHAGARASAATTTSHPRLPLPNLNTRTLPGPCKGSRHHQPPAFNHPPIRLYEEGWRISSLMLIYVPHSRFPRSSRRRCPFASCTATPTCQSCT